jgi:hypothetical protein
MKSYQAIPNIKLQKKQYRIQKDKTSISVEKEIDVLVSRLYELTYEEVKMIEKDFWLSEIDFMNIKL